MSQLKMCYGCMNEIDAKANKCQHCGYSQDNKVEECYLLEGTVIHNRYIIGKVLGHGGFGITYIAYDKRINSRVAIKEYMPGDFGFRLHNDQTVQVYDGEKIDQFNKGVDRFLDEAKTMAKYNSISGIATTIDFIRENNTAYMVMEFLDGETLESFLDKRDGKIPYNEMIELLIPVMDSLVILHNDGIIHRDISPDNIFITKDGRVKLIDFGAAREASKTAKSYSMVLKQGYAPEEQYRAKGIQGPFTDIYALAATMYKCLTGVTPVESMERVFGEKDIKPLNDFNIGLTKRQITILYKGLAVDSKNRFQDATSFKNALIKAIVNRSRLGMVVRRGLAAVVVIAALAGIGYKVYNDYWLIEIPSFTNVEKSDVIRYLENSNILYSIEYRYDDFAKNDVVIEQSIIDQTVQPNSSVDIVVCNKGMKTVDFEDQVLSNHIKALLEISEVTLEDVLLVESLDLSGLGIESLMGIHHFTELRVLDLSDNNLIYVSELESLENLERLNLMGNTIRNTEFVESMESLKILDLSYNEIVDDRFAISSQTLENLDISNNYLIKLLGSLDTPDIQYLHADHNMLVDITDIENMSKLEHLNLCENKIEDISPLRKTNKLYSIELSNNNVEDVEALNIFMGNVFINLRNNPLNTTSNYYDMLKENVNLYD